MRKKFAVLLLAVCGAAAAQSSGGYLYIAPGGATGGGQTVMTVHTGAGLDVVLAKGIGANLEISTVAPKQCFADCYIWLFSPGATVHFRRGTDHKVDPFLAGGYSVMFKPQSWGWPHANLLYFGAGMNYWASKHAGLRLGFRDHELLETGGGHLWGFRIGLALR